MGVGDFLWGKGEVYTYKSCIMYTSNRNNPTVMKMLGRSYTLSPFPIPSPCYFTIYHNTVLIFGKLINLYCKKIHC